MASPIEDRFAIMLLKYSLEEIEVAFSTHLLPAFKLEEDKRRQTEKTLEALHEARIMEAELKASKEENTRLTAKLTVYQRECREIEEMVKNTDEECKKIERLIEQKKIAADLETSKYEEEIEIIIEKFRQSANVYDEEKMKRRTEEANKIVSDIWAEKMRQQNKNDDLKNSLNNMKPDVPENILEIVGKTKLEKKLQDLQKLHAGLRNAKN